MELLYFFSKKICEIQFSSCE